MSKVGVLGGTFDPIHYGHLRAAEVAREELTLDRVLFVPAANPPHKRGVTVTAARDRVAMLNLVLESESRFEVSHVEIERGGASYTIQTLDELQSKEPSAEYWFITGSDAFVEIRTWKEWQTLLRRYRFAVHQRPGVDIDLAARAVPESYIEGIVFLEREMLNVSSTDIRRSVRNHKSIRFLVPEAIVDYIRENRLYQS